MKMPDDDGILKWIFSIAAVLATAIVVGMFLAGIKISLLFFDSIDIWGVSMTRI